MDNTRHEKQNTLKTGFPKIKLKICRKSVALLLFIFNSNIVIRYYCITTHIVYACIIGF